MPQRRRRHHLDEEVFVGQGHVVSITVCTAKKSRWLANPLLARIAEDQILTLHEVHPVLGYCLMPDHVHLVICNAEVSLGRIMNLFKGRTSCEVRKHEPGLAVWHRGYWDHIVRREEGLYRVPQYVLMNPVRAGLVDRWWDYQWLGSPMLGTVGPEFFGTAEPEDIMWSEILRIDESP